MTTGVGDWDKAVRGEREVRRERSVCSTRYGHSSGADRIQQVVCCRVLDETWRVGLYLEELSYR